MKQSVRLSFIALLFAAIMALCACAPEPESAPPATLKAGEGAGLAESAGTNTAPAASAAPANAEDAALLSLCDRAPSVSESDALAVLRFLDSFGDGYAAALAAEGRRLAFPASLAFDGGALVLAAEAPADGAGAPNLYFIRGGAVAAASWDADAGSINLARLNGCTILFGQTPAANITSITASFYDGKTAAAALSGTDEDGAYLLFAEGASDLAAITFFSGDEPVTDETDALYAAHDAGLTAGTSAEIFARVRLVPLYAGEKTQTGPEICIPGNEMDFFDWAFTRYEKDQLEFRPSDAWRNNNSLWQRYRAKGGSTARIAGLPDDVAGAYLVSVTEDTGGDFSGLITSLSFSNEKVAFPAVSEETEYRLVIDLDDAAYALPVVLEP